MNKVKIVALGIILILLFTSMLLFFHSSQFSSSESLTSVEKAVDFLVNIQFNQSIGLCREAPKVHPNIYWLVSDNLWAWKALSMANESGLSNAAQAEATADKIKVKLAELALNYKLPTDSNGLPKSYAHEAVIGEAASPPYNNSVNCTLYNGDYVLNTTIYNGTVMFNWNQDADLLLYAALSCHWQGNDSGALPYFNSATQMWNETSKGLQDARVVNGTYATYKLALLLYTSKLLGQNLPFESELVDRILAQQRESDGGIITDYYANGTAAGDANTETTSMVIIALLTPPKTNLARAPTFAFYYPWYGNSTDDWHDWHNAGHNPDNITDGKRDIAATDYPSLGAYDSNNETVIDQQVKWANDSGIDCFIISWWGINSFSDNASKHIRNVCERDHFKFTFYVENTSANYGTIPSIGQTVDDITYLLNTYGNSSSFYKIDGRPVIFVYKNARDSLDSEAWIWHACTDSNGTDLHPGTNESASLHWLPAEEVRVPPRLGIIPFQPFNTTPGFVESADPIHLQSAEEYWLNAGISDMRNDSTIWSDVGIKIKMGLDPTCNDTLYDQIVNFTDGWIDLSLPINMTRYAGKDVYLKAESYNGGQVNWSSEWAAIDYFYVTNSSGKIVSPDPFFDNGWNETIYEIRAKGYTPYVIMDFGGYETKIQGFIDYFSDCIDGIHVYNPFDFSNNTLEVYDVYHEACELAHSYDKTFIATVIPGFNNIAISGPNGSEKLLVVDRRNGAYYNSFWLIAHECNADGYAITSFNEWHEGTEIEPSVEYGDQYLNLTKDNTQVTPEFSSIILVPFMIVTLSAVIVYTRKHYKRVLR